MITRYVPSEMLDRSLATSVGGIVSREGAEESSDDRDDLASVRDMSGSFFEDKECCFGVDSVYFPCVSSYHSLPVLACEVYICRASR